MPGTRLIIGLMSGTSHDGVDAALVSFGPGEIPRLIKHTHTPCPAPLRRRIHDATGADALALARLDFDIAEFFARSALDCLKAAKVSPRRVDAVASHGQTVAHIPPEGRKPGATMQLGSAAVIAKRTGIKVVSDFRAADIAAGGQGAPLVPFADRVLFGHLAPCTTHNLGGISNVTILPGRGNITAFDTGPANSLLDEAAMRLLKRPCDRAGASARKGTPDGRMIKRLLSMPYFRKRPPKSTGREMFGPELLESVLKDRRIKAEDMLCTLSHFTARSIGEAYRRFVPGSIKLAVFSGGGTRNKFLMELIQNELSSIEIKLSDDLGVPSDAREAMSFAILANETLNGRPSNLPSATGARSPAILGSITPAG